MRWFTVVSMYGDIKEKGKGISLRLHWSFQNHIRADSRLTPGQWETSWRSNTAFIGWTQTYNHIETPVLITNQQRLKNNFRHHIPVWGPVDNWQLVNKCNPPGSVVGTLRENSVKTMPVSFFAPWVARTSKAIELKHWDKPSLIAHVESFRPSVPSSNWRC